MQNCNESGGFRAAIAGRCDASCASRIASAAVAAATGAPDEQVQRFLEGPQGGRFAGDIVRGLEAGLDLAAAAEAAITRWDWPLGSWTTSELGLPEGTTWLAACVLDVAPVAAAIRWDGAAATLNPHTSGLSGEATARHWTDARLRPDRLAGPG